MMMFCAARDGVDAAFLLQTVLGGGVDVNGAGVECEGALRDRQRRESGGAAKKQCSQDALHVWSWRKWNDYCRSNGNIQGYLIEWGGPADTSWGQVNNTPISFTTTKNYNPATQGTFCAHQ